MSIAFETVIFGILDTKNFATSAAPKLSGSLLIMQQILSLSSLITEENASHICLKPSVKFGVSFTTNSLYFINAYDRSINDSPFNRFVSM